MATPNYTFNQSSALLLQTAIEAGITSPAELANLMGNAHVETAGFSTMHERFGYRSADRIIAAVSSADDRFTRAQIEAAVASREPSRIATILYENRSDLGNTEPGDGWRFHGRGYLQYTGRANYAEYGRKFGVDLEGQPDLAAEPRMAARLAVAYWQDKIPDAQREDVRAAARRINGGDNGMAARVAASDRWADLITTDLVARVQSGQLTVDRLVGMGAPALRRSCSRSLMLTQTGRAPSSPSWRSRSVMGWREVADNCNRMLPGRYSTAPPRVCTTVRSSCPWWRE